MVSISVVKWNTCNFIFLLYIMSKTTKIVVRVTQNHPTGARSRAGFKFWNNPQQIEVTSEQRKMIEEDKYLLIVTKWNALKQAKESAKKKEEQIKDKTDNNPEVDNWDSGSEDTEWTEWNDNDSKDEWQADDLKEDSDEEETQKPITKNELKAQLEIMWVEFWNKDNLAELEDKTRKALIIELEKAWEEFSSEAEIKDLIALVVTI